MGNLLPAAPVDRVAYHRLLREAPRYRWWRPVALIVLVAIYALSLSTLVQAALTPLLSTSAAEASARLGRADTQDPVAILVTLASLASWLLAVPAAMWSVGISPVGRVWSVLLRPRWGLLLRSLGVAAVALAIMQGLAIVVTALSDGGLGQPANFEIVPALWSVLIVLLLVPLQAAGEEFVFRGALLQAVGSWMKSPVLPIVVPTLIFASLHVYDAWGWAQIIALGVISGWLAWRTGGLEASIALHVVNNIAVYLLLASGITGVTAQQSDAASLLTLIISTLGMLGYAWVVVTLFRRSDAQRWLPAAPTPTESAAQ